MAPVTLSRPLAPPEYTQDTAEDFWGVVMIVGACVLVAALGVAVATPAAEAWYAALPKPDWAPAHWAFGAAWTALYSLMALAAVLVWQERERTEVCDALTVFGVHLLVNLTWQVCFFGLGSPLLALLGLALLWVLAVVTAVEFFRVSRPAGWLMLPTIAWVTFAGAVNVAILFYVV